MIHLIKKSLSKRKEITRLFWDYTHEKDETIWSWEQYKDWHLIHSQKLRKFRNIHKGKDCFIIGNGPSLNKMDLSLLNDYYTFGLNKIYLIFKQIDLLLSYHVAVNPYVIQQGCKEIKSLKCPSFIPYELGQKYLNNLENVYFIDTNGSSLFQGNLLKKICQGHTVTYVAMQLAYCMGFERVFLIGVDHNFQVKGNPNELQVLKGKDINHFSPEYFANQEWQLPDLEASELFFSLAKYRFEFSNRKIFDATLDGKLNIFPKLDFNDALKMCTKKDN